jgi:Zn-dependent peptidase ImmA (M78 family)
VLIISSAAHVNPAILKWAREHVGLSVSEAAKGIVTAEKLATIEEGGDVHLTYPQFLNLARRYKVSVLVFYNSAVPDRYLPLDDLRTAGSRPVKEEASLRKEMERIIDKRETMVDIIPPGDLPDYSWVGSIPRDSTTTLQASENIITFFNCELEAREGIKDEYDALRFWKNRFDQKGILVFQVSNFGPDIARGFSIKDLPYPVIAITSKDAVLGRVFTLLHELVHLFLDERSGVCKFLSPMNVSPVEQYCNAVAAEILVPQSDLLSLPVVRDHEEKCEWNEQTIVLLSKKYWVSREVIMRRLLDLGKTTQDFYDKEVAHLHSVLKAKPTSRKMRIPYVTKILKQNPPSFLDRVMGAAEEQLISYSTLSRVLNMNLVHLQDLQDAMRNAKAKRHT